MSYNLNQVITPYSYIRSLFVSIVNGYYYMEYWFIYELIAYLILVPFVGKFITKATKKEATIFLGIILIYNIISTFLGYNNLEFILPYAFGGRSIFFFLGYFIDKYYNTKKEKKNIYIFGILSFIITLFLLKSGKYVNIWSYSLTFTLISVMFYIFIRDHIKINKIKKVILMMGKYSLPVYMLHMIFIYTYNDLIPKGIFNNFLYHLIIIILTFISCLICGILLEKTIIKWLKKGINILFDFIGNKFNKKRGEKK